MRTPSCAGWGSTGGESLGHAWSEDWVVIAAALGGHVTVDRAEPGECIIAATDAIDGISYEARPCPPGGWAAEQSCHQLQWNDPGGAGAASRGITAVFQVH